MQTQAKWSRRDFLRLSGATGVLLLAACQPVTPGGPVPMASSGGTVPAPTATAAAAVTTARFAYTGVYTRGAPGGWSDAAEAEHPVGIGVFTVDATTGALTSIQTVPSDNPSFVALHPLQPYLYAINEIADYEGAEAGSVEAYAIDDDSGELTFLNRQAVGSIPAHLAVDPSGTHLVIANYVGASFNLLPIGADGTLGAMMDTVQQSGSGPHPRQEAPHPHAVVFDPNGNYLATADLGLDKLQIFEIVDDKLVQVSEASVAPGSGPRHVAFHPSGNYLYTICELKGSVVAFAYDSASGQIGAELQTIGTVPADFPEERSTAEIMVHPLGRFLYGSNRKSIEEPLADSIVAYTVDEATGELALIGHTSADIVYPRAFNFDPSGAWLYACNQKGDTIVQLAIDAESGELTPTGLVTATPVPVSLVFKE